VYEIRTARFSRAWMRPNYARIYIYISRLIGRREKLLNSDEIYKIYRRDFGTFPKGTVITRTYMTRTHAYVCRRGRAHTSGRRWNAKKTLRIEIPVGQIELRPTIDSTSDLTRVPINNGPLIHARERIPAGKYAPLLYGECDSRRRRR